LTGIRLSIYCIEIIKSKDNAKRPKRAKFSITFLTLDLKWVKLLTKEIRLEVKNLRTYFFTDEGISKAVDGVDFQVFSGETLGIVGESGCGKSVTSLSIMRLISSPPGRIMEGEINFNGVDLTKLETKELNKVRGKEIAMIFQEPMTSLNPLFTIGEQITENILKHENVGKKKAVERAIEMLKKVGIPLPEQRINEYPHQLSGGMRQRAMIAMALSCHPQLLIADEPTTALDVTIQAQILELINELKKKSDMSVIMITHNLGVIAEMANRVAVMYAGEVVEYAAVNDLFQNPLHPYTWGLMNAIPRLNREVEMLYTISGVVPSATDFPAGCRFHPRCQFADQRCQLEHPILGEIGKGHMIRCWKKSCS